MVGGLTLHHATLILVKRARSSHGPVDVVDTVLQALDRNPACHDLHWLCERISLLRQPKRWLHSMLRLANSRQDKEQIRRLCRSFFDLEGINLMCSFGVVSEVDTEEGRLPSSMGTYGFAESGCSDSGTSPFPPY